MGLNCGPHVGTVGSLDTSKIPQHNTGICFGLHITLLGTVLLLGSFGASTLGRWRKAFCRLRGVLKGDVGSRLLSGILFWFLGPYCITIESKKYMAFPRGYSTA